MNIQDLYNKAVSFERNGTIIQAIPDTSFEELLEEINTKEGNNTMDHFSVSSGVGIGYEKIKPLNIAIKAITPELHKLGDILNEMENNAEAVVLMDDFLLAVKREILFGGE